MKNLTVGQTVDVELVDSAGDVELRKATVTEVGDHPEVAVDHRRWALNPETLTSRLVNGRRCRLIDATTADDLTAIELLRRSIFKVNAVDDPEVARKILDLLNVKG